MAKHPAKWPVFWAGLLFLAAPALCGAEAANPPESKADQPPRKVIVGTAIFGPYGDYPGLEERLKQLSGLIDEMALQAEEKYPGQGLDLAILPESAVTATSGPASMRAITLEGAARKTFADLARRHGTYIIAPMDLSEPGTDGTTYANAAVLFDRRGQVAGIYRKVHPVAVLGTDELEQGITPGREYPVFDCDFGKLGIQICWDIQFDDGWEALRRKGAEIVAWPSASPATAQPAARAGRQRYYIVSSTWREDATLFEPTGLAAAQIEPPDQVLVHQIDLSYAVLGWSPPCGTVRPSKRSSAIGSATTLRASGRPRHLLVERSQDDHRRDDPLSRPRRAGLPGPSEPRPSGSRRGRPGAVRSDREGDRTAPGNVEVHGHDPP